MLMVMTAVCCHAQLGVFDTGTVGVASDLEFSWTRLFVGNRDYDHRLYDISTLSAAPSASLHNIGVEGVSLPHVPFENGHFIGVRGLVGRGASGYNYGVLGNLQGIQNGAGVFGCDGVASIVAPDGTYGGSYVPPYNTKFDVPIGVVANILRGTIY